MDSSTKANYQFMMQSNGYSKKSTSTTVKCCVLLVILVVVILLLLSAAIGLIVGVSVINQEDVVELGLSNVNITTTSFQGEYHETNNYGIYFSGEIENNLFILNITTTKGQSIVYVMHSMSMNMTMIGINDTYFMVMENQQAAGKYRYDEFVIPNDTVNMTMSIMTEGGRMTNDMLQRYDNATVNETRQSMLYNLAMREEAILIIKAAQALGEKGIEGSQYIVVMKFYMLALRLQKIRGIEQEQQQHNQVNEAVGVSTESVRSVRCSSNGAVCQHCPTGDGCLGQCGYGCFCWSFVCGDCCLHTYCLTHDNCCADAGFFTFSCFQVIYDVTNSRCTDIYEC